MYFPTSAAQRLLSVPPLPKPPQHRHQAYNDESIIDLCASPSKTLFCALSRDGVSVWRVRPPVLLAHLSRTPTSIHEHGANQNAQWSPNGDKLVIKTYTSYLLLIALTYTPSSSVYGTGSATSSPLSFSSLSLGQNTARHYQFLPGAGEGVPITSVGLSFEGVVRVEGALAGTSLRKHGIIFSTAHPGTIQRVPWPSSSSTIPTSSPAVVQSGEQIDESDPFHGSPGEQKAITGHDVWILNSDGVGEGEGDEGFARAFKWLMDREVSITQFAYSRSPSGASSNASPVEAWVTSDGRAYFAQLQLSEDGEVSLPPSMSDVDQEGEMGVQSQNQKNTPSSSSQQALHWLGTLIHDISAPRRMQKQRMRYSASGEEMPGYETLRQAVSVAVNTKFSVVAVGTRGGAVELINFPTLPLPTTMAYNSSTSSESFDGSQSPSTNSQSPAQSQSHLQRTPTLPPTQTLRTPHPHSHSADHFHGYVRTGSVTCMEWSSDGYVLAVGFERGWALWSVGGRCLAHGFGVEHLEGADAEADDKFRDAFMFGVGDLFWGPGNFELFVLSRLSPKSSDGQIYIIPFAKSAVTEQQSPDNARYAFLQMDDRVLVYRGADQPDMSVINPESDVWQHVKIPLEYLSTNWPIRYSTISADGRLIAVAGRRGLIHYSTTSGRWKIFSDHVQEQAFAVRGGLLWFNHILIAAVEVSKSYQIRLYSRDLELSSQNILHREVVSAPVVTLSLVDNSLLAYTTDNTLSHYIITPTKDGIQLQHCGSISFIGVIAAPSVVRGLSWMIPNSHKQLGDPVDDLTVATVLMMVGGRLVLLRPQKSGNKEVRYDMQILADRIEFCWIHLRGIGTLENSLWGYDGKGIRVWLNALNMESKPAVENGKMYDSVRESVKISLDFYPLSVLMDKGIIIGAEHDIAARSSLPFVLFRHSTSSHLFIHHILLFHLEAGEISEAVLFASHYQELIYFAHALEILLHTIVESRIDVERTADNAADTLLTKAVEFLDHFDVALDVVVGCARKTEMARWKWLFEIVGSPKSLFETCLASGLLKTAGSYLLVLHNLEQLDEDNADTIRLLKKAMEHKDWQLCRELLRFLHSIDDTGVALRDALTRTNTLSIPELTYTNGGNAHIHS